MPVVSVVELDRDADASVEDASLARIFSVTNRTASAGFRQQNFEVPSTPSQLMGDIGWYLEDFVSNAFETKRADKAKQALKGLGAALVKAIDWASVVGPDERKEPLLLSIQERPSDRPPLFWELLEDPQLWEDPFPAGVFVSRYHDHGPRTTPTVPITRPKIPPSKLNILVVATRLASYKDIPHRIVSRILHDKVHRQADQLISPTYLKILRPPTWAEFKRELETKGAGFYSIIHFDTHGDEMVDGRYLPTNNHRVRYLSKPDTDRRFRQGLTFLEGGTAEDEEYKTKHIATSDLAPVLARHGTRRIVLNACRSAQYRDVDESIALGLLKSGVEQCVAMSFNVLSRSVEIFMSVLYDALLTKGLPLDAAAAWARQALRRQQTRRSCYATNLSVYDYIIPMCYTNSIPQSSDAYVLKGRSLQFRRTLPFSDVMGREGDILSIETRLLLSDKALLLWGLAGTGKTALLRHLGSWWQETGLVAGVYFHDFRDAPRWNHEEFWRGVHNVCLPTADYQGPDAAVNHLRTNRYIIIMDSLPGLPGRSGCRFISQILKPLAGGSTKVILATRFIKDWENDLGGLSEPFALKGLGMIDSLQLLRTFMTKAIRQVTGRAADPVGESPADLRCFEQISRLLDGNPAALRVIVSAFLYSKANSMKEFLELLMVGEPLMNSDAAQDHLWSIGSAENFPCVEELLRIISGLACPRDGEYAVPVEVLAPFWKSFPRGDEHVFLRAFAYQFQHEFGSTFEEQARIVKAILGQNGAKIDDSLGLAPEAKEWLIKMKGSPQSYFESAELKASLMMAMNRKPAGGTRVQKHLFHFLLDNTIDYAEHLKQSPIYKHQVMAWERIANPLKAADFLSEDSPTLGRHYRIHPLVPLLLRASPLYHFEGEGAGLKTIHIKQAFVYYYTYRTRAWPFDYQYFEPQWKKVRKELDFEFMNFMTATATFSDITKGLSDLTVESLSPLRIAAVLHRGVVPRDFSRFQLAHFAVEKALDFVVSQENRRSDSAASMWRDASTATNSQHEQNAALFALRLAGVNLSLFRATIPGPPTAEENKPFVVLAGRFFQRLKEMGTQPGGERLTQLLPSSLSMRYIESLLDVSSDSSMAAGSTTSLDNMWNLHQEYLRDTVRDPHYTGHRSKEDLENTKALSWAWNRNEMKLALGNARVAMEQGQLDKARKLVDSAWKKEVLKGNNEGFHKVQLLELRAEICERDEDWESAAEHYDEAKRIRGQLVEEASSGALDALGALAEEGLMVRLYRELKRVMAGSAT